MGCERSWDFGVTHYRCVSFGYDRKFLPVVSRAELSVPQWQPRVGYLSLTIRSVRLGLNVQTFRLAIHLNLFRGDSAVLCGIVEGHCVHLIHLLIQTLLFSLIELQGKKRLTHLSRVISLPNHNVCLEYSQTLYEFG